MEYVNELCQNPREFSQYFKKRIDNTKTILMKYEEYIKKPMVKCCVVGNVSTGKSTLINALLERDVLYERKNIATLCAAICQSSSNHDEYFKIYKGKDCLNERKLIAQLKEINFSNNDYLQFVMDTNNYLDIYLDVSRHDILDKFVLIDCPGFNDNNLDAISKYCKNADIIVFCFKAEAGITDKDIDKIEKIKERIGKFQISFIINCFNKKSIDKQGIIYKLSPLLTGIDAIYFISALEEKENRLISSHGMNVNDISEFELFKECLQKQKSNATITYNGVHLELISSVNELVRYLNCGTFQNYHFSDEIFSELQQEIFRLINNDKKLYYKDDANLALMEYSDKVNKEISKFMVKHFIEDYDLNKTIIDDNCFYKRFVLNDAILNIPTFSWYNWGVKSDEMKKCFLQYFSNNSTNIQKQIIKHYDEKTKTLLNNMIVYKNKLCNITNIINQINQRSINL